MGVKQKDHDDANETIIDGVPAQRVAIDDLPQELQDEIAEDLRRMEAGLPPAGKLLTDFPRPSSEQ